ncbi:hypothetical protein GGD41_004147 [Paraburkholderia bryophila]|uniref:Uncharacterized protein n=1 Tax=Paraburkholderia bryophila TaxID=420952 RepID=A0A7Y9W9W8_9BURK|nr:hypothetical protein [Paraburkholderia bryophila]
MTRDHAVQVLAFVDITEVAGDVRRVALLPQTAAMRETHLRILRRHLQHVWVEVTERGREDQRGAVLFDHRFHGFLHGDGFRHVLFLDHLHIGHLLDHGGGLRLRLVVTVVAARADVDHADGGLRRGKHRLERQDIAERQHAGAGDEVAAAGHGVQFLIEG